MLSILILLVTARLASARGRFRVVDRALAAALFLCFWPAAAWLFVATLERPYPVNPLPRAPADAIVVLGGNYYPSNASQPEARPGVGTSLRAARAAWLFHHWKHLPVVVSGGTGNTHDPALAALMRGQLIAEGVPDAMISVEEHSSTTYENAAYVARVLLPNGLWRIALVTEAYHMRRAELTFQKQGFDVVAAPCSFRTLERHGFKELVVPDLWAPRVTAEAMHEWVGLA